MDRCCARPGRVAEGLLSRPGGRPLAPRTAPAPGSRPGRPLARTRLRSPSHGWSARGRLSCCRPGVHPRACGVAVSPARRPRVCIPAHPRGRGTDLWAYGVKCSRSGSPSCVPGRLVAADPRARLLLGESSPSVCPSSATTCSALFAQPAKMSSSLSSSPSSSAVRRVSPRPSVSAASSLPSPCRWTATVSAIGSTIQYSSTPCLPYSSCL